ncbi:MAG: flagellar basal body P-ring formation chaperone FlgA [Woeseiaceae bacterium]
MNDKILTIFATSTLMLCGILIPIKSLADWQPIDDLVTTAHDFLASKYVIRKGETELSINRPDPRLRLQRCERPLTASALKSSTPQQRMTIQVRCEGAQPWKVYLQAQLERFEPVVVTASSLSRGQILAATDLVMEKRPVSSLTSGYLKNVKRLVGNELRQTLPAGSVLRPAHVKQTMAIRRGQTVTLVSKGTGIHIRMTGVAVADAAVGARIPVKNQNSGRIVEGIVLDTQTVQVPGS